MKKIRFLSCLRFGCYVFILLSIIIRFNPTFASPPDGNQLTIEKKESSKGPSGSNSYKWLFLHYSAVSVNDAANRGDGFENSGREKERSFPLVLGGGNSPPVEYARYDLGFKSKDQLSFLFGSDLLDDFKKHIVGSGLFREGSSGIINDGGELFVSFQKYDGEGNLNGVTTSSEEGFGNILYMPLKLCDEKHGKNVYWVVSFGVNKGRKIWGVHLLEKSEVKRNVMEVDEYHDNILKPSFFAMIGIVVFNKSFLGGGGKGDSNSQKFHQYHAGFQNFFNPVVYSGTKKNKNKNKGIRTSYSSKRKDIMAYVNSHGESGVLLRVDNCDKAALMTFVLGSLNVLFGLDQGRKEPDTNAQLSTIIEEKIKMVLANAETQRPKKHNKHKLLPKSNFLGCDDDGVIENKDGFLDYALPAKEKSKDKGKGKSTGKKKKGEKIKGLKKISSKSLSARKRTLDKMDTIKEETENDLKNSSGNSSGKNSNNQRQKDNPSNNTAATQNSEDEQVRKEAEGSDSDSDTLYSLVEDQGDNASATCSSDGEEIRDTPESLTAHEDLPASPASAASEHNPDTASENNGEPGQKSDDQSGSDDEEIRKEAEGSDSDSDTLYSLVEDQGGNASATCSSDGEEIRDTPESLTAHKELPASPASTASEHNPATASENNGEPGQQSDDQCAPDDPAGAGYQTGDMRAAQRSGDEGVDEEPEQVREAVSLVSVGLETGLAWEEMQLVPKSPLSEDKQEADKQAESEQGESEQGKVSIALENPVSPASEHNPDTTSENNGEPGQQSDDQCAPDDPVGAGYQTGDMRAAQRSGDEGVDEEPEQVREAVSLVSVGPETGLAWEEMQLVPKSPLSEDKQEADKQAESEQGESEQGKVSIALENPVSPASEHNPDMTSENNGEPGQKSDDQCEPDDEVDHFIAQNSDDEGIDEADDELVHETADADLEGSEIYPIQAEERQVAAPISPLSVDEKQAGGEQNEQEDVLIVPDILVFQGLESNRNIVTSENSGERQQESNDPCALGDNTSGAGDQADDIPAAQYSDDGEVSREEGLQIPESPEPQGARGDEVKVPDISRLSVIKGEGAYPIQEADQMANDGCGGALALEAYLDNEAALGAVDVSF